MRSKLALRVALTHLCSLSLFLSFARVYPYRKCSFYSMCENHPTTKRRMQTGPKTSRLAGWKASKQHVWWVTCIHFSVKENRSNLFVRRSLIFRRPSLAWSFGRSACDTFSCLCVTLSVVACL